MRLRELPHGLFNDAVFPLIGGAGVDHLEHPMRLSHLWRWRENRMVVFSDATFNVRRFDFNLVGGMVWEQCDGDLSAEEISARMTSEFPAVPVEVVRQTVVDFLHELEREWLVTTREALAAHV